MANVNLVSTCLGTASRSMRIGRDAFTCGCGAVSLGPAASAKPNGTAVGSLAGSLGFGGTAIGQRAKAYASSVSVGASAGSCYDHAVSVGVCSRGDNAGTAIGYASRAAPDSVALGARALSNCHGSIAIGKDATAYKGGVAIGTGATACQSAIRIQSSKDCSVMAVFSMSCSGIKLRFPDGTCIVKSPTALQDALNGGGGGGGGGGSSLVGKTFGGTTLLGCGVAACGGIVGTAVGNEASLYGCDSVAVGQYAQAVGGSTVIGHNARATCAEDATAVGAYAESYGNSVAIGRSARADQEGVAIGKKAYAANMAVAIGGGARATGCGEIVIQGHQSCEYTPPANRIWIHTDGSISFRLNHLCRTWSANCFFAKLT